MLCCVPHETITRCGHSALTSASNLLTERLSPWYALDGCRRGMPWTAVAIARARTDCILIPVGSYKAVRIRSLPIPIPNDQPIPDYFHEKLRSTNTSRAAMQCLRTQPSATSHKAVPRERRAHARRSATGTPRPAKGREAVPGEPLAQPRALRQCLGKPGPSQGR